MVSYSIAIPNFNGSKFLSACLKSLLSSLKHAKIQTFEIILIDNASSDDSPQLFLEFIRKNKIKRHRLIRLDRNYGFSKAVNTGIQSAKYKHIVLLNNDIVFDRQWFYFITKNIQSNPHRRVAVFSGTILNYDGSKYESQGLSYQYSGKCLNINNQKPFTPRSLDHLPPSTVWGSSAAVAVYRRQIFDHVGMFDEDFFAYEEDVDLCLRLNNSGYKTLYIPQAIAYHYGGGTSSTMGNFRQRMDAKNWFYIIIKNYRLSDLIKNLPAIFLERLRNLSGLIKATPPRDILPSLISTYFTVIANFPRMIKKRQINEKK